MISTIVAAALVAAQVTPEDFDRGFARGVFQLAQGRTDIALQLFVSPVGEVEGCSIISTNWTQRAADRACERLIGKKLSQAAKTADGTPVHGTALFALMARPAGSRPRPLTRAADLTVSLASLPEDANGKVTVGVLVLVDSQGAIIECSADPVAEAAKPAFVTVACEQLKPIRAPVRNGTDGNPVPYVTDFTVEFVVDASPRG